MPVSQAERAGERRPLAHAAGKLRRIVVHEVLEPDRLQRLARAILLLCLGHALEHHAELDVLDHRAPRKQRVLLEHEGDLVRQRTAHRLAADLDRARGRRQQAADHVEQRALAAAARPDQAQQFAAHDVERGVEQRAHMKRVAGLAEFVRDALDPYRGVARCHFGRNDSLISLRMSGSSGSVFMSTNERLSTASAFGLKRPSSLNIGIMSS